MTSEQLEQVREALEAQRLRARDRAERYCETGEVEDAFLAEYNLGLATGYGAALAMLKIGGE